VHIVSVCVLYLNFYIGLLVHLVLFLVSRIQLQLALLLVYELYLVVTFLLERLRSDLFCVKSDVKT